MHHTGGNQQKFNVLCHAAVERRSAEGGRKGTVSKTKVHNFCRFFLFIYFILFIYFFLQLAKTNAYNFPREPEHVLAKYRTDV